MLIKNVCLITLFLINHTKVLGRRNNHQFLHGRIFKSTSCCIENTIKKMSTDKPKKIQTVVSTNRLSPDEPKDKKPTPARSGIDYAQHIFSRRSHSCENLPRNITWPVYYQNYCYSPLQAFQYSYQNQVSYNSYEMMQQRFMGQHRRSCSSEIIITEASKNKLRNKREKQLLASRYWQNVTVEQENTTSKKVQKPGFFFTVMSYNVLAQDILEQHLELYKNHSKPDLKWETRWNNILKEVQSLSPDILCLQEVQESHLSQYFAIFETLGYKGLFKQRTGGKVDGCAIYYKEDIINLIEYETVEYFQPNITMLNRDNVALIAKFAPKLHPTREFVVATTHLLYNPKRQDVRLAQTQIFLTEIERLSFQEHNSNGASYAPVILTGDLNSSPDSVVYDFIIKGKVTYENLTARSLESTGLITNGKVLVPACLKITDTCQHASLLEKRANKHEINRTEEQTLIELINSDKTVKKITFIPNNTDQNLFCSGTLSHQFAFRSIYTHGEPNNVEGTTFQRQWLTVDYIFYSGSKRNESVTEDKLKLISRYRLPRKSELNGLNIPNRYLGSDHLSLVAKFKLEFT